MDLTVRADADIGHEPTNISAHAGSIRDLSDNSRARDRVDAPVEADAASCLVDAVGVGLQRVTEPSYDTASIKVKLVAVVVRNPRHDIGDQVGNAEPVATGVVLSGQIVSATCGQRYGILNLLFGILDGGRPVERR